MKTLSDTDLPADYLEVIEAAEGAKDLLTEQTTTALTLAAKAGEPFAILTAEEWESVFAADVRYRTSWADMVVLLEGSNVLEAHLADMQARYDLC